VTDEGGKVVRTPKYNEQNNVFLKKSTVLLDSLGNAVIQSNHYYAGLQAESLECVSEKDEAEQKKYFYKSLKIKQFDIKKLHYQRHKTRIPTVDETFEVSVEKLASVTGKRLFLPLNLFSIWDDISWSDSTRQYDVQADDRGFTQLDSIEFQLPVGFRMESKYAPIALESEFGSYEMKVTSQNNKILFYRKMVLNNKILPKEKFELLNDFLRQVIKADKSKLVLVKN
jgi:hypothetical protein